ncbi:response regulator [Paucibacter sp. APW11]|uniref:Response regulator n=1 Tax=Roseateles aquae TaxID=3077235 RepID=A0ABU3P9R3_9BURK|nr:response regulator [Paucibacter sp. APW11]MDT8999319.1 response regulator [Paucibacter sp. APW11]
MSTKGKILVVDDDRLVLATLTHGLSQAGYEVLDADNGDDAILLAREHRPDLALLDIRMEGLSGFDVAAYLREYLQMPFMFLSAFADEDTVEKVKALGAVAYLVKPLDIHQIVPAVEAAFAKRVERTEAHERPQAAAPVQPASTAVNAGDEALQQVVAIALGVLMHRYSLSRQEALARLKRLAESESRALHEQASRLLEAVELLAMPAH